MERRREIFNLAHTKGSSFVSVRALARKAMTNLNIRWNKRTYVFELIEGDAPVLALNLEEDRAAVKSCSPHRRSRPRDWLRCWIRRRFRCSRSSNLTPWPVRKLVFGDEPQVTDFNDHEIRIEEVFDSTRRTRSFSMSRCGTSRNERFAICRRVSVRALAAGSITSPSAMSPGLLPPCSKHSLFPQSRARRTAGEMNSLKNEFSVLVSRVCLLATRSHGSARYLKPATVRTTTAAAVITFSASATAHGMTPEQEALARQTLRRV